ncbi:MinD/ParA family ATP-binding protein [Acrocarpospora catenulata]|uniref:MinD/ParA family ATP-binding protein n=1 Tax=Acrocarpospora catenulata TaxID=2836182 RepID=UPI0027E1C61F|nr:hypothetical protein [Acrocarpospora catenulata]
MALIVLAADKGAPGVTTAATALGAVWPRPVLLAECDPAGGDLAYRLPGADGGVLNPARGLLSLGAVARRGLHAEQILEHTQKLVGGLDVLAGLANGEQAAGLTWLWGPLGRSLAALPHTDVLADCGRLGAHPEVNELLAAADQVVLFTRPSLDHVAHLRERLALLKRPVGVVVIADPRSYRASLDEVRRIVSGWEVSFVGGLAYDPKGAELLRGQWGGRLDRSLLIRTARELANRLAGRVAPEPEPGPDQGPVPGSRSARHRSANGYPPGYSANGYPVNGYPPDGYPRPGTPIVPGQREETP